MFGILLSIVTFFKKKILKIKKNEKKQQLVKTKNFYIEVVGLYKHTTFFNGRPVYEKGNINFSWDLQWGWVLRRNFCIDNGHKADAYSSTDVQNPAEIISWNCLIEGEWIETKNLRIQEFTPNYVDALIVRALVPLGNFYDTKILGNYKKLEFEINGLPTYGNENGFMIYPETNDEYRQYWNIGRIFTRWYARSWPSPNGTATIPQNSWIVFDNQQERVENMIEVINDESKIEVISDVEREP